MRGACLIDCGSTCVRVQGCEDVRVRDRRRKQEERRRGESIIIVAVSRIRQCEGVRMRGERVYAYEGVTVSGCEGYDT